MAENKAVPIEERRVDFYGDELTAALVQDGNREEIYVPIKPLCDVLGLDWSSQSKRIRRDAILSKSSRLMVITTINPNPQGGRPDTLCLPLKFLPGWLFGITPARVRPELRDKILRYQEECYDALARAFVIERPSATTSPAVTSLTQIREMALAIAEMAEQQIEYERRITTTEGRLDRAAVVVGQIRERLTAVERKLSPGNVITDEQAGEVQTAVHALGMMLTEQDKGKNHFQGIFNELHRRFGVTSYKLIPQGKYGAVLAFLGEWLERARG